MSPVGSLFSGCGALDLAVEAWSGGRTVWQVERDPHCQRVLARHWPDVQRYGDVEDLDPATLPPVDVLCGGFPCQDLSTAGSRAGLDGSRSGLYRHLLRFARDLRPEIVVIENVPALLHQYRARVERDWSALGYGVTWRPCSAAAAGAPHLRRRVFLLVHRGRPHGGVEAIHDEGWSPSQWATPTATIAGGSPESADERSARLEAAGSRPLGASLGRQVVRQERRWPTTTAKDAASGNRGPGAHPGTSLTDALVRRPWATPTARDWRNGAPATEYANARPLSEQVGPGRLNADWHACLMGLPPTWTAAEGPSEHDAAVELLRRPRWPAGRGEEQHPWEPPRLVSGPPQPGRPARIRASGNAVVPQAALLALAWSPAQLALPVGTR